MAALQESRTRFAGPLILAVQLALAPLLPADSEPDAPALYRSVCATCHGLRGEGRKELFSPSIAGLPDWYVVLQMEKFRRGFRGLPPDHAGMAMRSIASALPSNALPALAAYVSSLERHPTEGPGPEDLSRTAEYFFENCAPCHRYNAHGERVFHSAPLTLLPAWYAEASLRKFRDKIRGGHPEDESGKKMQEKTAGLTDELIRELAAYLAVLAEKYPPGKRQPREHGQTEPAAK